MSRLDPMAELHKLGKQPDPPTIRYYTAAELQSMTLPEPEWIVRGFVALQAITELDGKIKLAGKTTWWLALVRKVLDGEPFMGYETRVTKVVYVTEQSQQVFMDALRRAGLADRGSDLRIVFRRDIGAAPWADACRVVTADAIRDGYGLMIVDTIGKLARIVNENDAGEWSKAMTPLQDAAHDGLAVGIARHDRKGGGEVTESGRGSSQGSGDVDVVLQIKRPEGNQPSNRRVIESASRYPDTPDKVMVELGEDGEYRMLGNEASVALSEAIRFVTGPYGLRPNETNTRADLVESGKQHGVSQWAVEQALRDLELQGQVVVTGAGRKGDPYQYGRPRPEASSDSVGTQNSGLQMNHETSGAPATEPSEPSSWAETNALAAEF